MALDADSIVAGAGLTGLVTATEFADASGRVILLEQESARSLGGQAWWSFGGLFLAPCVVATRYPHFPRAVRAVAGRAW